MSTATKKQVNVQVLTAEYVALQNLASKEGLPPRAGIYALKFIRDGLKRNRRKAA
jgi:hypothetical protein